MHPPKLPQSFSKSSEWIAFEVGAPLKAGEIDIPDVSILCVPLESYSPTKLSLLCYFRPTDRVGKTWHPKLVPPSTRGLPIIRGGRGSIPPIICQNISIIFHT